MVHQLEVALEVTGDNTITSYFQLDGRMQHTLVRVSGKTGGLVQVHRKLMLDLCLLILPSTIVCHIALLVRLLGSGGSCT